MLIDFFMKPGEIKDGQKLYDGQAYVQSYLLTVALISLPWMLLAKPLMLRRQYLQVRELIHSDARPAHLS